MWDFRIGRTLVIMAQTWPFIVLRLFVYFGITVGYVFAVGAGAGVGYGVGHIFADGGPEASAFYGGFIGFALISFVLYWIREYILYIVKAGHIAVMVHLIDGREVPGGQGQIAYARAVVTQRFGEANVLFLVDQLVKGAIAAITGLLATIGSFIPGLSGIIQFVNTVIRLSLTYVDEVVLGYNIRTDSKEPFESARKGVVLYAQNGWRIVKNAVWLAIFMWVLAIVVFIVMLAPAAAIVYVMPGDFAGWSFVLAIVFAWAVKAALIEPFVICALMDVYFRAIEGQQPDPEWDERLSGVSRKFRELKDRAASAFGGRPRAEPWQKPA